MLCTFSRKYGKALKAFLHMCTNSVQKLCLIRAGLSKCSFILSLTSMQVLFYVNKQDFVCGPQST